MKVVGFIVSAIVLKFVPIAGEKMGFFDFSQGISATGPQDTVEGLSYVLFKGNLAEKLPDQVTICLSLYLDLTDRDGFPDGNYRDYAGWAIKDDQGKLNASFSPRLYTYMARCCYSGQDQVEHRLEL